MSQFICHKILKSIRMKYFVIVLTIALCGITACKPGQAIKTQLPSTPSEDSIATVINTMFTAMRKADGALLKSTFSDSIVFQTISRNREGKTVVRTEDPQGFIDQISKAKPDSLDERISFETIKIDGPLAFAWTPYSFYYNGQFSHCGVNSFQLVRFNGAWKIQYIIDTRRRVGCSQ
jgi:hypothetical protein